MLAQTSLIRPGRKWKTLSSNSDRSTVQDVDILLDSSQLRFKLPAPSLQPHYFGTLRQQFRLPRVQRAYSRQPETCPPPYGQRRTEGVVPVSLIQSQFLIRV